MRSIRPHAMACQALAKLPSHGISLSSSRRPTTPTVRAGRHPPTGLGQREAQDEFAAACRRQADLSERLQFRPAHAQRTVSLTLEFSRFLDVHRGLVLALPRRREYLRSRFLNITEQPCVCGSL